MNHILIQHLNPSERVISKPTKLMQTDGHNFLQKPLNPLLGNLLKKKEKKKKSIYKFKLKLYAPVTFE